VSLSVPMGTAQGDTAHRMVPTQYHSRMLVDMLLSHTERLVFATPMHAWACVPQSLMSQ